VSRESGAIRVSRKTECFLRWPAQDGSVRAAGIFFTILRHNNEMTSPGVEHQSLVFLHIPKTAGTTLWLILRRQYSPPAVLQVESDAAAAALTPEQLRSVRVLMGHFSYGSTPPLPHPAEYVTMIRDPVERMLSSYSHLARVMRDAPPVDNPAQSRVLLPAWLVWNPPSDIKNSLIIPKDRLPTLDEFFASGFNEPDNRMTRMLAGPDAMALPFGGCDERVFDQAKHNLLEGIAVVGVTERFDEMLVLLQRRYGWNSPLYVKENVGGNRLRREEAPPEVLQQILDNSVWDRKLYEIASARFAAQVAEAGPGFEDAVRRFRWANGRYRRMKTLLGFGPLRALKSRLSVRNQMGLETFVRSLLRQVSGKAPAERPPPPPSP
jgi:hypothetical protein